MRLAFERRPFGVLGGIASLIYHFTIRREGEPFLAAAAQFERRHRIPIATVISTRHSRQEPLRRAARAIRRTLPALPGPTHRLGPHYEIANVNDDAFRRLIRPGDVGISTIFDQIFDQATIGCFRELVNIHPSLLPLYRGPDPLYWVLANGETASGVTLHEITPRIDAGPIRFQERVDITHVHTRTDLRRLMVAHSIPIFVRYLEHIALGAGFPQHIEDAAATYRVHLDYAHDPKRPRRHAG